MTNESRPVVKSTAAAALLDSMHVVRQTLLKPDSISPKQLRQRIHEWQLMMVELVGDTVKGAELATLYEMIGVMNSSLDLTKTLGLVMDSLIHLTGAERGCLMLLDEAGNLEIKAAQSFDRDSVDAFDLELSHTVVQEAVETRQPVLTTNAQSDPRFSDQASVVDYQLRSIICVPLHVREKITGALYLDNRMRDAVFSKGDLPILMAFASQAAVAIENALLYTMTDQALAARVEELTTLQEIDQELGTSLDIERVLDVTLSWALQGTGAARGTLSVLEEEGAYYTISCCIGDQEETVQTDPSLVRRAMDSQEPFIVGDVQMLVPMRYDNQTVGLLDIRADKNSPFQPDHAQFAGRLAGHAAVAIENARLHDKVRHANQDKADFVSYVAHELRTPMTSIRGYADMLAKELLGPLTPDQAKFIGTITRNAERMQILISDLQDITRIESDQLRLELKPTSLADALHEALQSTREKIKARSHQLTTEIPEDLPQVQADPKRLEQIVAELLRNGTKYTPEGGEIRVRVWLEDDYVHCTVSDSGVGISLKDQTRLFTKFFRSESPAIREMPGTGLGLFIVRHLIESQGGEIKVESQIDAGTAITFTVPVARS